MINMEKNGIFYREVENTAEYVRTQMAVGAQVLQAEKTARIHARPGIPGTEKIVSWSVDADGRPVLEKETTVSADEAGIPDWVATKLDSDGNVLIDANGHVNQWVIGNNTFCRKYEAVPDQPGVFKPVGGIQQFLRLTEGIHIRQWGEEWNVDAGGYINITDPADMYVISGRDFADSYRRIG